MEKWRKLGWLIPSAQGKSLHMLPLDGLSEPCVVLDRTKIDPLFVNQDIKENAAKVSVLPTPIAVNMKLTALDEDEEIVVKKIVPYKTRDHEEDLPLETPAAQALLANLASVNERKEVELEFGGKKWLAIPLEHMTKPNTEINVNDSDDYEPDPEIVELLEEEQLAYLANGDGKRGGRRRAELLATGQLLKDGEKINIMYASA